MGRTLASPVGILGGHVIANEHPTRIALCYEGRVEIVGAVGDAFRRIEELVQTHPSVIPVVSRKRRPLNCLPRSIADPINGLLHIWSNTAAEFTHERRAQLCTMISLDDMLIIRNPRKTDKLLFENWGKNFDFFGPRWVQIARGRHVVDQPFPKVAHWTASHYREALEVGGPNLDEISLALLIQRVTRESSTPMDSFNVAYVLKPRYQRPRRHG